MISLRKAVAFAIFFWQASAVAELSKHKTSLKVKRSVKGPAEVRKVANLASFLDNAGDPEEEKNRPMRRVIDLLKKMQKDLKVELDEDEDNYDKMSCWCDVNEKRLRKQIKDSRTKKDSLIHEIEYLTAMIAELETQIKHHKQDWEKYTKALDEGTELRKKQRTEFHAEETDLMESIGALRGAIIVLEKENGHGTTLLQMPSEKVNEVSTMLQSTMQKHGHMLEASLSSSDRQAFESLLQTGVKRHTLRYNPQSGTIFGILTQMKETFEQNLKKAKDEDEADEQAFQDLKDAKEKQIKDAEDAISEKSAQLAQARERCAFLKASLPNVKEDKTKDEAFIQSVTERCNIIEREWPVRKDTRQKEIATVQKTLELLNSEEAHKLFTKTFNPPEFLQERRGRNSEARSQASKLLAYVAKKVKSTGLSKIAIMAQLDGFARVKKAIDVYIATLLKQKRQEVLDQERCKQMQYDNEESMEDRQHAQEEAEDKAKETQQEVDELKEDLATTKQQVADLLKELKRATEERNKNHEDFKKTIADHASTVQLLNAALKVLRNFYDQDLTPEIPVLAQGVPMIIGAPDMSRQIPEDFGFDRYDKKTEEDKEGGVIVMIKEIIKDSEQMVTDAKRDDRNDKEAYELLKEETSTSVSEKSQWILVNTQALAKKESELAQANQALEDVNLEVTQLHNEVKAIDEECGFLLKNFEIRQDAIEEEVEALKQAKAIMAGALHG